jgi:hypothetical protein
MFTTLLDLKLINVETYYFRVESQNAYGHALKPVTYTGRSLQDLTTAET